MLAIGQTLVVGSTNDWLVITAMGILQVGLAYAVHGEEPYASTIFGGVVIIGSVAAGSVIGRTR